MVYTEEHLAALRSALARREQSVTFEDGTVDYASVENMRRALSDALHSLMAQADVAGLGPRAARRRDSSAGR